MPPRTTHTSTSPSSSSTRRRTGGKARRSTPSTSSRKSGAAAGRGWGGSLPPRCFSVRRSARELLLAGLDGDGELVLRRRQRAGGEGREGAGRVVGGVEVHHHLTVPGRIGVDEAAGAVGLLAAGLVGEDQEQLPL